MRYVYPGSFCPPTYGHLHVVTEAAKIFSKITIICSSNPEKKNPWFSEDECKKLWRTYKLPKNVEVKTLNEFRDNRKNDTTELVMIRGIRSEADISNENKVMLFNKNAFGITKYFYIICNSEYENISSSEVRRLISDMELENLSNFVSPLIISSLLEKILEIKNVFMVVGKPGSGKSTLLNKLIEADTSNGHINTDEFSEELKPLIRKCFPGEDIIKLALTREDELVKIIKIPWINLLKEKLASNHGKKNVFIEIPYGLRPNKLLFNLVGGKVIYFGCDSSKKNNMRNLRRNTGELKPFIALIPGKKKSIEIGKKHGLMLHLVDTSYNIEASYKNLLEILKGVNNES